MWLISLTIRSCNDDVERGSEKPAQRPKTTRYTRCSRSMVVDGHHRRRRGDWWYCSREGLITWNSMPVHGAVVEFLGVTCGTHHSLGKLRRIEVVFMVQVHI